MSNYSNDIKRYLNGEMTAAERNAFERKALSDPFLADALEGAEQVSSEKFTSDLDAIHQRIETTVRKSALTKLINPASEENVRSLRYWAWVAPIAATLLLIAVSTFVVWRISRPTEQAEQLAFEQPAPNAQPTDVLANDSSASSAPASTELTSKEATSDAKKDVEPARQSITTDVYSRPSAPVEAEITAAQTGEDEQAQPAIAEVHVAEKEEAGGVADNIVTKAASAPLSKVDDLVYERKKEAMRSAAPYPLQNNATIVQGKVAAEDDSPLSGINVIIKGTTIGTITDAQGNYQLPVGTPNSTLVYSFIGLQSQEVTVGNRNEIDVRMQQDASQLSEVVVVGHGATNEGTKSVVNFAHTQMGSKAFKNYLETNLRYPQQALDNKTKGRVTVEFIVEPNGELTDFTVVRGIGSGCEEELIRLIKEGPSWIATQKDSVPIRDKVRVQLTFALPKK
jgi:TonB family protein